jgi:hypothetical protein
LPTSIPSSSSPAAGPPVPGADARRNCLGVSAIRPAKRRAKYGPEQPATAASAANERSPSRLAWMHVRERVSAAGSMARVSHDQQMQWQGSMKPLISGPEAGPGLRNRTGRVPALTFLRIEPDSVG